MASTIAIADSTAIVTRSVAESTVA